MSPSPQKVALVTGAARGIGLATAKRFLAEGWRVALLDIEGELLRGAVARLAKPGETLALDCDVSDSRAVAAAFDASRQNGSAGWTHWSTMRVWRCSRRCWRPPMPTGAGSSRSISPAPFFAPRRRRR